MVNVNLPLKTDFVTSITHQRDCHRFKRGLKEGGIRAVGVVNTFAYLAGVRGDVEFCKRAVAEKKRLDAVNKGWDIEQGSAAANSAGPGVVTLKLTER